MTCKERRQQDLAFAYENKIKPSLSSFRCRLNRSFGLTPGTLVFNSVLIAVQPRLQDDPTRPSRSRLPHSSSTCPGFISLCFSKDLSCDVNGFMQILIALIAFFIAIATCTDHHVYSYSGSPNGYLMMAAIMCLFDTAALGCIGVLSLLRPQDLASYLVLVFDILALAASIAAGQVSRVRWKRSRRRLLTGVM